MSSLLIARAQTIVSVASLITVTAALTSSTAVRAAVKSVFSPSTHPVRFAALVLAFYLNVKNFPLVWHYRFFKTMFYQLYFQPAPLPKDALFRPVITSSMYTPIPECDYNGHKSNSTYFSDCDMARTQLITVLLRKGINSAGKQHGTDGKRIHQDSSTPSAAALDPKYHNLPKGRFMIALGAVSCHFKREIKPYERFEMWTRVLSWDRKWIYVVSHLVKDGAVMPDEFTLQPGKARTKSLAKKLAEAQKASGETGEPQATTATEIEKRAEWKNAIFASCISKYVVKKGRLTINPEIVLENSSLLPPRPDDPMAAEVAKEIPHWTWDRVEQERLRGYEIAAHFGALDGEGGLHDEFPVARERDGDDALRLDALGKYSDLIL